MHLYPHQRTKLESRAMKCVFVGYNTTQKGYKVYHPSTKIFFVSMDVTFHEHELFFFLENTLFFTSKGGDLEMQNHDRLNQDIKLFDVMPTTTDDGIQDNGDENMEDPIQYNINENMVKDDSTDIQCNVSSTPTSDPIMNPYTFPPRLNRELPPIKYEIILNCKVKYPINNYVLSERFSKSHMSILYLNYLLPLLLVVCRKL